MNSDSTLLRSETARVQREARVTHGAALFLQRALVVALLMTGSAVGQSPGGAPSAPGLRESDAGTRKDIDSAPAKDPALLFPGDRGAQRMVNLARDPASRTSVTGLAESFSPDWSYWWTIDEICLSLEITQRDHAVVEALLKIRSQSRATAIEDAGKSQAASILAQRVRELGVDLPDAEADLATRAEFATHASRAMSKLFAAFLLIDREFADTCARHVLGLESDAPSIETASLRMERGVQRLRVFDPALSKMDILNNGVDLRIHVQPLLEHAGDQYQAVCDEIATWQQRISPKLDVYEQRQADRLTVMASEQRSLESKMSQLAVLRERTASNRAEILASTLESAKSIAQLVTPDDADRPLAWLRSVYHAFSPMEFGPTGGDAAIDAADRFVDEVGAEGRERKTALAQIRSSNLRACAELEGALVAAMVHALQDREIGLEYVLGTGAAHKLNERRIAQSTGVLRQVIALFPPELHSGINHAFQARRARSYCHLSPP